MNFRQFQLAGRSLVVVLSGVGLGTYHPAYIPAIIFYCLVMVFLFLTDYGNDKP